MKCGFNVNHTRRPEPAVLGYPCCMKIANWISRLSVTKTWRAWRHIKKIPRVYVKIIIITLYKTRSANNYILQILHITNNYIFWVYFRKTHRFFIVMVFIFYLLRGSLTQISVDGRRRTYLFENFEDLIEYRKRLERIKQFY